MPRVLHVTQLYWFTVIMQGSAREIIVIVSLLYVLRRTNASSGVPLYHNYCRVTERLLKYALF